MRVLVSPLDWGLGHATRMIPVVRYLMSRRHEVLLAGSGDSIRLLSENFPALIVVPLKSFSPKFVGCLPAWTTIIFQIPNFVYSVISEHILIRRVVKRYNVDFVISDNRYGLFMSSVRCAFITHQLSPIPWLGAPRWIVRFVSWVLSLMIRRYNYCLIPDKSPGLYSGKLSFTSNRVLHNKIRYIGILSRFFYSRECNQVEEKKMYSVQHLVIASGPRKERVSYVKCMIENLEDKSGYKVIVTGGIPKADFIYGDYEIEEWPSSERLYSLLMSSEHIYSHSGYTTIMDLATLGLLERSELTPTPGQAEQEYLFSRLKNLKNF